MTYNRVHYLHSVYASLCWKGHCQLSFYRFGDWVYKLLYMYVMWVILKDPFFFWQSQKAKRQVICHDHGVESCKSWTQNKVGKLQILDYEHQFGLMVCDCMAWSIKIVFEVSAFIKEDHDILVLHHLNDNIIIIYCDFLLTHTEDSHQFTAHYFLIPFTTLFSLRCQEEDLVVALDSQTKRLLHCEKTRKNKKFSFPLVRLWSISIFSCSLTRNITSQSMENLAFHSLLTVHERWLYYQFSLTHVYISFLKGWENVLFKLLGVKGLRAAPEWLKLSEICHSLSRLMRNLSVILPWI